MQRTINSSWDQQMNSDEVNQRFIALNYLEESDKSHVSEKQSKQIFTRYQNSIQIEQLPVYKEMKLEAVSDAWKNFSQQNKHISGNKADYSVNSAYDRQEIKGFLPIQSLLNIENKDLLFTLDGTGQKKLISSQNQNNFQSQNKKWDFFNQRIQEQIDQNKIKKRTKSQFWSENQVSKFNLFLILIYQNMYEQKTSDHSNTRIKWNLFNQMASFIGTKNNIQCRTKFNRKIKQKSKLYSIESYLFKNIIKPKLDKHIDISQISSIIQKEIFVVCQNSSFKKQFADNLSNLQFNVERIIEKCQKSESKAATKKCSQNLANNINKSLTKQNWDQIFLTKIPEVSNNASRHLLQFPDILERQEEDHLYSYHSQISSDKQFSFGSSKQKVRKTAEFWKKEEIDRFNLFLLLEYQNIYEPSQHDLLGNNPRNRKSERTRWCFFKDMGFFIGNKTNTQCRSRFYRMIKEKSNVPTIEAYLYQKFLVQQRDFDQLVNKIKSQIILILSDNANNQQFLTHAQCIEQNLKTIDRLSNGNCNGERINKTLVCKQKLEEISFPKSFPSSQKTLSYGIRQERSEQIEREKNCCQNLLMGGSELIAIENMPKSQEIRESLPVKNQNTIEFKN